MSRPGATHDLDFEERYVFEDEEVVLGELQFKMISSDEDWVELGFKLAIKNVADEARTVYVPLNALDTDGFKVESVTLGGKKLRAGEVRVFTEKETYDPKNFRSFSVWSIEEVTSYEE